jgi:glucokinase
VRTPTPVSTDNGAKLITQLTSLAHAAIATHDITAIGISTPGVSDETAGIIRYATNLKVRDLHMKSLLHEATGLPIGFSHDGRASALAESLAGAAQGHNNFALMPIGTGISVGLMIDGVIPTSDGFVGEVGHANTGHGVLCECGLVGCLEAVASTASIARRYNQRTGENVDAKQVVDAAHAGDVIAIEVWDDALDAIAFACDWLMNTLSPEAIVFAGGLSAAGARLIDPLETRLSARIGFQRRPKLKLALLGDDSGVLGAAAVAMKAAAGELA